MKLKLAQNSIFAILLRSSWGVSALIALAFFAGALASTHPTLTAVLFFGALPFVVISIMAAWKQRKLPSAARIEQTLLAVRGMSWEAFSTILQEGLVADGCTVTRLRGGPADYLLERGNRLALVSAKRWKASQVGVQALRDLDAARQTHEAHEGIYVTLGEISEAAQAYAKHNHIRFLTAVELARLLPKLDRPTPRT